MPTDAYWAIAAFFMFVLALGATWTAYTEHRRAEGFKAQIAKFDHDGDGKVGGSSKK